MLHSIPISLAATHTRAVDDGSQQIRMKQTLWHATDTNHFFQVRHPRCVSIVQLYLKVVLDYILEILYFCNGILPYQPRDSTNTQTLESLVHNCYT
jgi:hypothetical protein